MPSIAATRNAPDVPFAYRHHPLQTMHGPAAHGRHRLRDANGRESTVSEAVWHQHRTMTGHYSAPQIVSAFDPIADKHGRANTTLQIPQLEVRNQVVA